MENLFCFLDTGGGNSRVVGWDKGQFDTGDNPSSREDISQMYAILLFYFL